MSADRRVYDRIPAGGEIRIKGKGRLRMYAIAINLSLGGALLSATPAMPVGSQWQVTLLDKTAHEVQTVATVVRNDAAGTALRFAQVLTPERLQSLVAPEAPKGGLLEAYANYFQVGRNEGYAGCQYLLGVTPTTFRRVFYTTFSASIPAAVLPVWLLRAAIQPYPVWAKIAACFLYAALWYLVLQPSLDVGILHLLRKRKVAVPVS